LGHRRFKLRDLGETAGKCGSFGLVFLGLIPCRIAVGKIEPTELPGEILMVQVQPIVHGQFAVQYFGIVHFLVGYFRIGQRHGYRIVPRLFGGRSVDGNTRGLFEFDHLHVDGRVLYLCQNSLVPVLGNYFVGDAPQPTFCFQIQPVFHCKTTSSVVQEPLGFHAPADGPEGYSVGLEMIFLGLIHGHQDAGCPDLCSRYQEHQE